MCLDVGIQTGLVEQERAALAILHDGQSALPDQLAQLPRTEAEVYGGIPEPEQAALGRFGPIRGIFGPGWIGHVQVTPLPK